MVAARRQCNADRLHYDSGGKLGHKYIAPRRTPSPAHEVAQEGEKRTERWSCAARRRQQNWSSELLRWECGPNSQRNPGPRSWPVLLAQSRQRERLRRQLCERALSPPRVTCRTGMMGHRLFQANGSASARPSIPEVDTVRRWPSRSESLVPMIIFCRPQTGRIDSGELSMAAE